MQEYKLRVEKEITVTQEDIDDIMCSALEGGITYWCRRADVVGEYLGDYASEQISRGGSLEFYDAESSDIWVLTLEKLLNGIQLAYEGNWFSDYNWCDGNTIDTCQVDAEVADCIIQFALFEDIIFG